MNLTRTISGAECMNQLYGKNIFVRQNDTSLGFLTMPWETLLFGERIQNSKSEAKAFLIY